MFENRPDDPYVLFDEWYAQAEASEPNDPNALCLATADAQGRPSARMMLMKGVDARGFTFYTNFESRKGEQMLENPAAAICFYWKSLGRQVRAEGPVTPVSAEEADVYFASRPRASRIGAWASRQSRPLPGRATFENRIAQYEKEFEGREVPRPPYWSGWLLAPQRIEFWQAQEFRLHHRIVYSRESAGSGSGWVTELQFP